MDTELLDLLQNYLRRREALMRRVAILQQVIEAQQRGETITPSLLEDYASQLDSVAFDDSVAFGGRDHLQWRH